MTVSAAEPVRAKDVEVARLSQARCKRPGCDWTGELRATYAEANDDRQIHLGSHRILLVTLAALHEEEDPCPRP